jgi:hypothetical protein
MKRSAYLLKKRHAKEKRSMVAANLTMKRTMELAAVNAGKKHAT